MVDFDVVVIGSGAGGLTAAVALAQAGKKVLVVEQHYLPGGWCHSFHLDGYRFSPGVHYIGECGPSGRMRRIYEGLGLGDDLELCELNPDGFDHVLLGEPGSDRLERFDIPKGRERLAQRLGDRFPAERKGIDAYLRAVEALGDELGALMDLRGARDFLALPRKAPTLFRWGLRTAEAMMRHHVRDPRLLAILGSQAGDHGLPPSKAPAAMHAAVAAHYFDGGWYPRGGGGAIPRAMIRALRRAGGDIRVKAPVERVLLERDGDRWRAIGVRLAGGEEIRAGVVLSNADPTMTYDRLVGREHLSRLLRFRLSRTRYGVSGISLFLAAELDARAAGLDSGNYWLYPNGDVSRSYAESMRDWTPDSGSVPGLFLTITTLKDPSKPGKRGVHTMEAFSLVSYDAFKAWADSAHGSRPAGYDALKKAVAGRMLDSVERIVPGLRERLVFQDVGTPLTNVHYVAATRGNLYGTQKDFFHIGPLAYQVRSEIRGLWLCGASTVGHGVMGATFSGLVAAGGILRCRMSEMLKSGQPALRTYPSEDPGSWLPASKERGARAASVAAGAGA